MATAANHQRILYIITKSNFGGAQKYVFELACAAQAQGHDVTVAFGGTGAPHAGPGLLAEKLARHQIKTIYVSSFARNMSIRLDCAAFWEIFTVIRKLQPDVVHVTSSKAGAIGALASRLCRIKTIIFTSHGLTMDESWRPYWQRVLIWCGTWCTLLLAHRSIMISQSTHDRARAMPFLKKKIVLIYNGIVPTTYLTRDAARAALVPHTNGSALWIGGIGELHPNKNWLVLLEALARFPTPRPQCVIIGAGEQHADLAEHITALKLNDSVHLSGFLDTAAQYLPAFDIFVLPSKKEGLPYVLLEAGLARCCVVASDISGCTDIITSGIHGLLLTPSPAALHQALQELVEHPEKRATYAEALHERVITRFAMDTMIQNTFATYTT